MLNLAEMLDKFGIKLTISGILLLFVVGIIGAVYKDKVVTYLLHSRNRGGFILAFLYAAIDLILSRYNLLSTAATYVLLVMDIAFVVYCSYLVKHSSFLAGHILKIYEQHFYDGRASEYIHFFDKRPWYISEKGEIIEYRRLQAMYLSATGDVVGAYHAVESIPPNWFYEEELQHFTIIKAMLLWNMGDFHTANRLLEDKKFDMKPEKYMLRSFVADYGGDFGMAYNEMKQALSLCVDNNVSDEIKVQIYYNFGRIETICGNQQDALYNLEYSCRLAKKLKSHRMDLVHICFSTCIFQMALDQQNKEKCERYINEYRGLIATDSMDNLIEFNNCLVSYYRQINDKESAYKCIKDGYYQVIDKIKTDKQKALYQASIFRMLMNGHFVHDWFDKEIEKLYKSYKQLPAREKLIVAKEFMGVFQQPDYFSVRDKVPYRKISNWINEYYKKQALADIDEYIKELDPHEIFLRGRLMQDRLGILKYIEKSNHIEKSKQKYLDLYKTWKDAGFMIESINTLMILADECISAYNVQVRFNPWMPPMLYQDVIDGIQNPPEPVLMENGIELLYPMFMPKVIEIIPTNDKVLTDVLAVIMPEVESWNNHPAKYEFALHIAHFLMALDRKEEAEKFFKIFCECKLSLNHYASWVREEYSRMSQELGNKAD